LYTREPGRRYAIVENGSVPMKKRLCEILLAFGKPGQIACSTVSMINTDNSRITQIVNYRWSPKCRCTKMDPFLTCLRVVPSEAACSVAWPGEEQGLPPKTVPEYCCPSGFPCRRECSNASRCPRGDSACWLPYPLSPVQQRALAPSLQSSRVTKRQGIRSAKKFSYKLAGRISIDERRG
jgi:hypothetical protein